MRTLMMSEDTEIVVIHGKSYQVVEWSMKDHGDEYVRFEAFFLAPENDDE